MGKKRILIIDDQAEVREEVRDRIESLGHEADEAAYQEDALKKVDGVQYDCVLLDLEIPVKFESPSRIDHGINLLQRIVAKPSAPPVIVITSHGLEGHRLAVETMEIGARTFVGKPFKDGLLEKKIQQVLESGDLKRNDPSPSLKPFSGGALVINDEGIELCEAVVGVRGNSSIREILKLLAIKKDGKFVKASGKALAAKITSANGPGSLTAAIKEFREKCTAKLRENGIECDGHSVIQTVPGGGYRLCDWIEVRLGGESLFATEVEKDSAQVILAFKTEKKLTSKQLREAIDLPAVRVTAAVERLQKDGKIRVLSGSGSTTMYEILRE